MKKVFQHKGGAALQQDIGAIEGRQPLRGHTLRERMTGVYQQEAALVQGLPLQGERLHGSTASRIRASTISSKVMPMPFSILG